MAQKRPTRADITKAKHKITDPVNNNKVVTRRTTIRNKSKGIKSYRTYNKARSI